MRFLLFIALVALAVFAFLRFGGDGTVSVVDPEPVIDTDPEPIVDPDPDPVVDPDPDPVPPFVLDHLPVGDLIAGSSRTKGDTGAVITSAVAPDMRFPLERGPAFLNSQIFRPGGGGYASGQWPAVGGQENASENYDYPWRDNFCEVRFPRANTLCPGNEGHQGQDIRPASCSNGAYMAVAPERVEVRNITQNMLVNLYGLETGLVYTMLHLNRPLAQNAAEGRVIQRGDTLERGDPIGLVSNRTSFTNCSTGRCTSLHLHFEIWHGAAREGAWDDRGIGPHSPYASLVDSYLALVATAPADEDWTTPLPQEDIDECKTP